MAFTVISIVCCVVGLSVLRGINCIDGNFSNYACFGDWTDYTEHTCIDREPTSTKTNFSQAFQDCQDRGGHLVTIDNIHNNNIVHRHLIGRGGPRWIGLKRKADIYGFNHGFKWKLSEEDYRDVRWLNWNHRQGSSRSLSYMNNCAFITDSGKWSSASCSTKLPYLCETEKICRPGHFGDRCQEDCHCQGHLCDQTKPACPYGCEVGWTGEHCHKKLEKAQVVYYCFNTESEGRHMVMHVDAKGVDYDAVYAVHGGVRVPGCDVKLRSAISEVKIIVNKTGGQIPPCGGEKINDHTLRWQFRLQTVEGVVSLLDQVVEISCDFSKADHQFRTTEIKPERSSQVQTFKLKETRENVTLGVISPVTEEQLQVVPLGTNVKLKMALQQSQSSAGLTAKGISTYSCVARGSNSEQSRELTDEFGCSSPGSPVSPLTGNDSTMVTSGVFSMFAFPSSNGVTVECHLQFCFDDLEMCTDRCSYFKTHRHEQMNRTRRSASGHDPQPVTAKVKVIPVLENSAVVTRDPVWIVTAVLVYFTL